VIDLVDDVPNWIIERFSKNTQGAGVYLVSLVCINDTKNYKVPHIYFGFVERKNKDIFIYLDPKRVGAYMSLRKMKKHFKILERVI